MKKSFVKLHLLPKKTVLFNNINPNNCFIKSILFLFLVLNISFAYSQNFKLYYGLSEPQDSNTLPKSNAKIIYPVRKIKTTSKPELIKIFSNEWKLSNGWEMSEEAKVNIDDNLVSTQNINTKDWYNATVPGTVLTTLVDQGVYPDPFFGINNLVIPDSLCRENWWYRTVVPIPTSLKGKSIQLLFNGINYRAEIWLNGNKIGRIDGAFIRGKFDITNIINFDKENILAVKIIHPDHPGIPQEASMIAGGGLNGGTLCYDGPTFIATEGWDWIPGIRDRDMGIWQDVRIVANEGVQIVDPQVISDLPLPDTTKASLTIETKICNNLNIPKTITIEGTIEAISFSKTIKLQAKETKTITFNPDEFKQLNITNPRLWWPNGYGNPELYNLKLDLINEKGDTSDSKLVRFGIRELSYDLSVNYENRKNVRVEFNPVYALKNRQPLFDNLPLKNDIENITLPRMRRESDTVLLQKGDNDDCSPYLVIKVNGQRIFCKGGNWGMDDGMKRSSRERLEPYIRLHRDEHFTMIRNWTGESTEEALYELCDEYGLLVWNEFWATTDYSNVDPWDNQLFMNNARDVVKRFRNHPSIAVWCARNEGFPTIALEDSLRWMIAQEDPTRHYNSNSRFLNLRTSGPWGYYKDQKIFFTKFAQGFNTEHGAPSLPTAETMRKFIPEVSQWPYKNDDWCYHDYGTGLWTGKDSYAKTIEQNYGGEVKTLEDFCTRAQILNYNTFRNIFEAYNSKLWNNTCGILLWMSHPAWPSTLWQTYSYDYETLGSYFGSMKACEPVHIQMNLHDNKVLIINTSLTSYNKAKVIMQIYDIYAKVVFKKETLIDIASNSRVDCFTPDLPANLPDAYMVRLVLKDINEKVISTNDYWRNSEIGKDFTIFAKLSKVKLTGEIISKDNKKIVFRIKNNSKSLALSIKLNLRNAKTNERILPAYFSDGYFMMLPNEIKEIILEYPSSLTYDNLKVTAEGYNVAKQDLFMIKK